MPTPARSATAAMGAFGSARNTSRAASRISVSLRAAWPRRPGSPVLGGLVMSGGYHWNGSFRSATVRGTKHSVLKRWRGGAMSEIRPYRVDVPQADLDDLHDRLRRALWPDELPGAGD